ncbi:NADPH-dependent FMN reductase [Sphingobacterium psychroaquaticum]|uniref:NAD(P)H-dependent FMN reductase n=1 Tax=Sphingobacterium psychroaquaticum TaxID=561061 RepID=A0A1X7JSD5_9SPHI|nr:NAD(P)H-dependent oxidoreductase [Sphingobacterium psychroaquaticum]QBQ41134.1 NADPH-dependent oxidoreductase [Sphingobacterium psychroaquaticum]SMG31292.1 NAD(P)H-dependent FMN reductase [Sphingobacterium psychroaquaticum]
MKILAFAGSNSSNSINKRLVTSVSKYYKEPDDVIEILDLNDYEMAIFSKDREKESGIPQLAYDFAAKIDEADFLLISFAENNGNYNAAYKNLIDWVSRIPNRLPYKDKKVFIMATSQGRRGGQSVLDIATARMPYDGATVLETFSLPEFNKNFEDGKGVTDVLLRSQLEAKVRKTKRMLAAESAE